MLLIYLVSDSVLDGVRLVPAGLPIPQGWRLLTKDEASTHKQDITPLLSTWTIAKLRGGWKIDGSGYGNKIMKHSRSEGIGEQLITKCKGMVIGTSYIRVRVKF